MSLPKELILKRGETVLATMSACSFFEMSWMSCQFEPGEAFAEFAPLFEEGRQLVHNAGLYNRNEDYGALNRWQDKLYDLGISLIDPADGLALSWYSIHPISENQVELSWHKKVPAHEKWFNTIK